MTATALCSYIFPVPILQRDSEELVTPEVLACAHQFVTDHGEKPFYSPCISTVRKGGDVLALPEFAAIKHFITECVATYCEFAKIDKTGMKFSGAWLNLYRTHGYQDLHTHEDSVISGVFYLQAHHVKDFVVQAPWHFFQPSYARLAEVTPHNCHNLEYETVTGRCLVFPSHLMHRTLPTQGERISLAFNVRYGD